MLQLRAPGTVRRPPESVRRGLTFWRRSIQARVLISTVVLSAAVVGVVGWFLLQQTREGLLDHRVAAVVAEAADETAGARDLLQASRVSGSDAVQQQQALAGIVIQRGETRGFSVVLVGPSLPGSRIADGGANFTQGLDTHSVPASLEEHFDDSARTAWTYTTIRTTTPDGTSERPGIAVGSQLALPADSEIYTIYYLFPLDEQTETLALVTRALLAAAALLLVLVAGVTWLVTRQVVTPVRMARQVAERLAAGRLQERLKVSGEDDLARLATSFNQMATNLQRQIRQLEELSRVQRRFVSDVSHELRTPLTTVRMAGDVLYDARARFDPATARAAELLQTELDRFETLLADLLEISRFDAGAAVLELDDVDLVGVAHRIVEATRPLADQRGVDVRVEAPDHPCLAEADVRRVERIVRNLVTNAIDHAHGTGSAGGGPAGGGPAGGGPAEGGLAGGAAGPAGAGGAKRAAAAAGVVGPADCVVVRVASDGQAAAIAVRDHGVGLAPGEAALVFNRFWRADPARARTSGGTGLGLSIALEDTHLHGGWLQAWGRPGEGAQFRLTLPRRAGAALHHSPLPLVPTDVAEPVR